MTHAKGDKYVHEGQPPMFGETMRVAADGSWVDVQWRTWHGLFRRLTRHESRDPMISERYRKDWNVGDVRRSEPKRLEVLS
jgi:hypothetical protein